MIALISLSTGQTPGWQIIAILALMAVAGLLVTAWPVLPAGVRTGTGARRAGAVAAGTADPAAAVPGPRAAAPATEADWAALRARGKLPWHRRAWVRRSLLTLVLLMIAVRDYAGPVGYDWPYLRGSDQFSHAVMAQEVLAHGAYGSYLVYPPGFASLSAVICRFSGLPPLRLYPVLAPALLVLTAVAAYALAVKLWGFWPGLAAAFLSGLVLSGSYASFAAGRYPDLTAAYFLLVMAVAALVTLYQQPSVRSVLLVTVLSASVVFYHSVASLYIALVLAVAGLAGLVWLVIARGGGAAQRLQARRLTAALAGALACTAVLAAGYAAYTYLHGNAAGGQSATSTAVNIALNSQPAYGGATILDTLGAPVVWLGVLGLAALAAGLVRLRRPGQVMAAVTLLLWCVVMYLGSRFAFDGFPVRFETDLGGPLAVVGAFGLVVVLRSLAGLARWRPAGRALAAVLSVVAAGTLLSHGRAPGHRGRPGGHRAGARRHPDQGGRGRGRVPAAAQHRRHDHHHAGDERGYHQPGRAGHGRLHRPAVLLGVPDRASPVAAHRRAGPAARLTRGPAQPAELPDRDDHHPAAREVHRHVPARAHRRAAEFPPGSVPLPAGFQERVRGHLRHA